LRTDEERHRGQQLCISAAEYIAPKQQKSDCQNHRSRYQRIAGGSHVASECYSNQAKPRDSPHENVGNSPCADVAVRDGNEGTQREEYDRRLHHRTLLLRLRQRAGRKPAIPFPTRHRQARLWAGNRRIKTGDRRADGSEPRVETIAKGLSAGGDGDGDEGEKHGVFGSRGAALIPQIVFDKIANF
jgi:hypothetical protein